MSERDVSFYIVDIFIAVNKVARYTASFENASQLLHSEVYWDATIRELEIIGEATKYLLKADVIDVTYRRIVDFRNQLSHGYFGIDEELVWDVIQHKLKHYEKELTDIIKQNRIPLKEAIAKAKTENSSNAHVLTLLERLQKEFD